MGADTPEGADIEVTPAMIKAGVRSLGPSLDATTDFPFSEALLERMIRETLNAIFPRVRFLQ